MLQPALSLLGRDPAACLEKLEAAGPRYTSRITFNTNVLKQAAAASPAWAKELAAAGAAKMERLLVGATPQRIMRLQYMVESGYVAARRGMGSGQGHWAPDVIAKARYIELLCTVFAKFC